MSKRRQFHVLDGVLRDLLAGIEDDGEGYQRVLTFVRIIADILDILEDDDADVPDADSDAGGERQVDLDLRDAGDGGSMGGPAPRHDSMRGAPLGIQATLDAQARSARAHELSHAALPGRPGPVVRADIGRRLVGGGGARS